MAKIELEADSGKKTRFGIYLALVFYLLSVFVSVGTNSKDVINKDVKTLTFAHWQLEDGFREGYDDAIRQFVELKASQGVKVNVIQTTVPFRGYRQWFMTQLIGGEPADIIELLGSPEQQNQYFVPLSQYIGKPNPFNKGTKFEKIPWKDTFIDGMDSALDIVFGEYFGVGTFTTLTRIYVNMDLLRKATGSDHLPENLTEWLSICEKMRQYGKEHDIPIIPIGVRGFDKVTLDFLQNYYLGQMNCNLNDILPRKCEPEALRCEVLDAMHRKTVDPERLYAMVDIMKDIGQYFGEGFTATDLEQTKYLFFSGNIGFFPEGSWNAFSMVNNSPFEVKIIQVPVIGKGHKYSKYYVGRPSEQGGGLGGLFGIPKASKNFDLSLEFLQFITSWKINQMVMVDHCKWPPAVKDTEYKGILASFRPVTGVGRKNIATPFFVTNGKSKRKTLECLEDIIVTQPENPIDVFKDGFRQNLPVMIEEMREARLGGLRALLSIEQQRSGIAIAKLQSRLDSAKDSQLEFKAEINFEFTVNRFNNMENSQSLLNVLEEIQEESN